MIYWATRRRSLLERAFNLAGPVGITLVTLWVVATTSLIPSDVNFFIRAAWVLGAVIFCIVTHECAHLATGLLLHRPVRKILIGRGATIFTARPGGIRVQVCADLTAGGAVYFSAVDDSAVDVQVAVTAAGPLINLVTGAVALALMPAGWPWLGTLAIAGLFLGASNAFPSRFAAGGREHFTDGMIIMRLVLGGSRRTTFFEGDALAGDAERVTLRSIEEAMDSESEQLTEAHLLAALDREPDIHALLAPARVAEVLHFAGPPNSNDVRPIRSPAVDEIYKVTLRVARDLGVAPANAACLCLALMAVPSSVASRLKDSGIDEDSLRDLARNTGERSESVSTSTPSIQDMPLERWGTAADAAVAKAFRIAMLDRAEDTGTQHLVAAIVELRESRGAQALYHAGFVLNRNHRAVPPGEPAKAAPPMTPELQSAIATALMRTGPTHACGTGELCLGLADGTRSLAKALFAAADLSDAAVLEAVVTAPREESRPVGYTPASRRMWELRGSARLAAGRYADARSDFIVLEATAPDESARAVNQNNVAWVSLLSADASLHADSLERSRAAVTARPDLPALQGTYAFALLENGSPAEAAAILEKTVARQTRPRDKALELCLLAMCRSRLGDPALARAHLAAAEDIDPKCVLLERARGAVAPSPILR